jgi:uncharacterized protein (DUF2236 family)
MALIAPSELLRRRIVAGVRGAFNDLEGGQQPVPPSDQAWFERDSPIRRVHADVVGMMAGGMSALLLQMLHPHALQGVLDHSNFRADMHGRLRRTARFIAETTFAHRESAQAAVDRVNRIHATVKGTLVDGTSYSAQDPHILAWVHVAGAVSFLEGYLRYARPGMPFAEQDEYFRQYALVGEKLGAAPLPRSKNEAEALMREYRPELVASREAKEIARIVLEPQDGGMPAGAKQLLAAAAIDILPPFARTMLGLRKPGLADLPARLATRGVAGTMRWAFRQN